MRTEIKTENLILRKYEIEFLPRLFEAASESKGGEFTRWMPWCHENYSIEECSEFLEKTVEDWKKIENFWQENLHIGFGIFDARTDKFLGDTGLNLPNGLHKFCNLGYWVRTSEQNRGIASEATRALAKAAFEDLAELNRIEIVIAIENIPSRKAAEKSGATHEGLLRKRLFINGRIHDAAMFSFVRKDFED